MLGITDEWAAYQFDFAVLRFAWHVDAGLSKKQALNSLLADPDDAAHGANAARYGDVRQLAHGQIRKVKINEDGTW